MAAYNLPLRALFDKDQGGSAIGGYRLAVPGGTSAPPHPGVFVRVNIK